MHCLICDDHALIRDALTMTLANAYPQAVISSASDFPSSWTIAGTAPDLIICDLGMPGSTPEEGIAKIRSLSPQSKLVILTGQEEDETLLAILRLGVHGFVTKATDHAVFDAAVRLVVAGGTYYPPRLLALTRQGASAPAPAASVIADFGKLSERQMEVLGLMARGKSNKEIGRELDISPATVKTHVAHVIACLGASNRTEAAMRARQSGLI